MKEPAEPGVLSRGLSVAANSLEALRAWATLAQPRAELVAALDPVTLAPTPALRRHGTDWHPINLPPVHATVLPAQPTTVSVAVDRREALDDLFFSLGYGEVLMLPLQPAGAGGLVLARGGPSYATEDLVEQSLRAIPLGAALASLATTRRPQPVPEREIAMLFDLARDLARAESALEAARAAASTLRGLLRPLAGAILISLSEDDPLFALAWPDGPAGNEAVARAAEAAALPMPASPVFDGAHNVRPMTHGDWFVPAHGGRVGIALAFHPVVPDTAARVVTSVESSLAIAAERIATQREREKDRLRDVVEGLPHGVALLAPDFRLRLWNRTCREKLEMIDAWPGESGRLERIASADLVRMSGDARRGQPATAEFYSPAGGRTFEIQVVPATASLPGTDVRETLLVLEDVTETRRHKSQLARAEKLSALGVLISGIVHEINNPLATILGYAQMLANAPQSAQRERWLRTLEDEAQRCQRIVGNLLAFARPQEPGRRSISLAAVAEKALSLVHYSFRTARIEAVLQALPDTPAVHADPDAILQALINLLTNALHAMEGHEGPRQVLVEVGPGESGAVVLTVSDTGPGIAPEHLDRVFDPFFTTKPEGKGTGLGLSLVVATVRDHGGSIEVESAPGGGACFRITLPIGTPTQAREQDDTRRVPLTRGLLAGLRVLVADDEPAVATLVAEVLEQAGARPLVHTNGLAALDALRSDPPDVVIWDFSLSGLSGAELLEELSNGGPDVGDRVVLVTGDMSPRDEYETPSGRRCPVLGKPFDIAAVLRCVANIAGIRSAREDS